GICNRRRRLSAGGIKIGDRFGCFRRRIAAELVANGAGETFLIAAAATTAAAALLLAAGMGGLLVAFLAVLLGLGILVAFAGHVCGFGKSRRGILARL